MNRAAIAGLIVLGLLVVMFAVIGILYITRGTPVSSVRSVADPQGPPPVENQRFLQLAEVHLETTLNSGNHIEIMINGDETYPRLWEDMRAARRSITLQMYYCKPGAVADTMKAIVMEKARAGLSVLFLFDAFGAESLPEEYFQEMRDAGARVAMFRPIKWYKLDRVSHRSHIRVVVVDGTVGYTGGFGLDDKWLGSGRREGEWRETNVRFTGPAVQQLQAAFTAGWAEATGELLVGDLYFPTEPYDADAGGSRAALVHMAPTIGSTVAERFLALSIAAARRTLYITASYFVPDDDFMLFLQQASERGVDVRLLTPNEKSDVKTTWYAGRARYERLLRAGIRIYEYQPAMMHAKTLVVDGHWSTVGTKNFDNRSLAFNDESNLVVLDADFGARMDSVFMADLEYAEEVVLETFRQRSWRHRFMERFSTMFSQLL